MGCMTCRIRKVKCDEVKPACLRCVSSNRKCDGYPVFTITAQRNAPLPALSLGTAPHKFDYHARRAMQYFQEVTAPRLTNHSSRYFWNNLVLQACYVDDSIKHLVVAVADLELQRGDGETSSEVIQNTTFSSHYSRALALINQSQSLNAGILLIACLLLIVNDEFQQNQAGVLQHLLAGCRIIAQYYPNIGCRDSDVAVEILGPVFYHIKINTEELDREVLPCNVRWPYATTESDKYISAYSPRLPVRSVSSQGFPDLFTASASLQSLVPECLSQKMDVRPPSSLFHAVSGISTRLTWWLISFNMFCESMGQMELASSIIEVQILRTHYMTLYILSRCAPFADEELYDQYSLKFRHICWNIENLLKHSFRVQEVATKLLIPAFVTATRWRASKGRRLAVQYLRECGWPGIRLATIAEQVILLEENDNPDPRGCFVVPGERRVRLVDITFATSDVFESPFARLKFTKHSHDQCFDTRSLSHNFAWEGVEDLNVQESIQKLLKRVLELDFAS